MLPSSTPSLFDDGLFPPAPSLASQYEATVASGFQAMRNMRVVIAGLARNIAKTLPDNIRRAEWTGQHFRDYRILVYENDSNDATPQLLDLWSASNPRVLIKNETFGDRPHPASRCLQRAERMAHYRREVQAEVVAQWPDFDCVLLVDWDVAGGWSLPGLATTFAHQDWDFVGSNGIILKRFGLRPNVQLHYDAWAFRLTRDFQPLSTKRVNRIHFHRGEAMVPVTSCFGGLGVYRMPAFRAGTYAGGDIEHVAMHRSLIEKGFHRIFLNPSQIVHYGRRHRSNDLVFWKWHEWLRKQGWIKTAWSYPPPETQTNPDAECYPLSTTATARRAG